MSFLSDAESKAKAAQAASTSRLHAMQKGASSAHPMARKSQAHSKAPPLPGGKPPKGIAKKKGYTFTMGKLSLLAISLSLMILGAFTFFSGFLIGAWYYGKTQPSQMNYAPGMGAGGVVQEQPVALSRSTHSGKIGADSGVSRGLAGEAQKIGLGSMAGGAAGYQAQTAVENIDIPGVPTFLQPFVEQVKLALGGQAGSAASQAIAGGVKKSVSAASAPSAPAPKAPSPGKTAPSSQAPSAGAAAVAHDGAPSPKAGGPATGKSSSTGDYSIQLGAYVAKENAESMTNILRMKNYDAYIKPGKEPSGQVIYYVRVGHYDNYDLAHTVALRFIDNNIPGATIVKVSDDKK